jgi:hypothetical protein
MEESFSSFSQRLAMPAISSSHTDEFPVLRTEAGLSPKPGDSIASAAWTTLITVAFCG